MLDRLLSIVKRSRGEPEALGQAYRFRAQLKHRKSQSRVIEIKGEQTLGDLDTVLRRTFDHDLSDHLSQFFPGQAWQSRGYGAIDPFRAGPGAARKIGALRLHPGDTLDYVYDFGDDIQHVLTLEAIVDPEPNARYPRVVGRSQPAPRKKKTAQR